MEKKLRLFEMFAGYGGASFALKKAGIEFECVGYSEIDKYAIQCYEQNHKNSVYAYDNYNHKVRKDQCIGTLGRYGGSTTNAGSFTMVIPPPIKNFGDCTKIDPNDIPDFDLLTGGFPCQAFSVAGKGLGEQDTRGTLFHEIIRIAEVKQPKYMLLENVKGLTNKPHKATFDKILSELNRIGYIVRWKILNSKEHGIPQNRERVFFVCQKIGTGINPYNPVFPEKEELKIFLKDILEDEVDEKYYLSDKKTNQLLINGIDLTKPIVGTCHKKNDLSFATRDRVANSEFHIGCLSSTMYKDAPKIIQINNPTHSNNRVYAQEGISPALNTMQGGNRQPFIKIIKIRNATKKGYLEASPGDGIRLDNPNSIIGRARVMEKISGSLMCNDSRGVLSEDLTIRKLTPTECFRLMGFLDDEINLEGLSNTQRYKLAGNGWDINLVSKIFQEMLN